MTAYSNPICECADNGAIFRSLSQTHVNGPGEHVACEQVRLKPVGITDPYKTHRTLSKPTLRKAGLQTFIART